MRTADYESKSVAPWAFALATLLALGGVVVAVALGSAGRPEALVGVAILVGAFALANFGVLTVRVSEREVAWFFGRGLIGRRLSLERVRAAESRRSPWYWGWGIRWTPRGWLWRAHGLDAVWLELEDGKRVGIGTQDPDGLVQALQERIAAR